MKNISKFGVAMVVTALSVFAGSVVGSLALPVLKDAYIAREAVSQDVAKNMLANYCDRTFATPKHQKVLLDPSGMYIVEDVADEKHPFAIDEDEFGLVTAELDRLSKAKATE